MRPTIWLCPQCEARQTLNHSSCSLCDDYGFITENEMALYEKQRAKKKKSSGVRALNLSGTHKQEKTGTNS